MNRLDDLKPIGTNIRDITDKIPSALPKPKLEPVKVDETLNADKMDSALTLLETLGRWWESFVGVATRVSDTIIAGGKIVAFVQTWGWAIIGLIVVFAVLMLTRIL